MGGNVYYENYLDVMESEWRWENFKPVEIASRTVVDGQRGPKGPLLLDYRALDMLQELRNLWGGPIRINSGYRSPEYNRFVGGATKSKHMEGIAFDIPITSNRFVELALDIGFKGIGYYPSFTHIDARIQDRVSTWGSR